MRENGSGRWKTVDIQRVTRATGIPWTGYTGPVGHRPKVDPARPSHPSPLRRHRPDDGPFGVGQVILTVVVRALMELLGGPVPGHGSLRIWVRSPTGMPHPAGPLNLWNKLSGTRTGTPGSTGTPAFPFDIQRVCGPDIGCTFPRCRIALPSGSAVRSGPPGA